MQWTVEHAQHFSQSQIEGKEAGRERYTQTHTHTQTHTNTDTQTHRHTQTHTQTNTLPFPPSPFPLSPHAAGLVLNFAVFEKEILGHHDYACRMVEEAFSAAVQALEKPGSHRHTDVTPVLQLLRENLIMWTST